MYNTEKRKKRVERNSYRKWFIWNFKKIGLENRLDYATNDDWKRGMLRIGFIEFNQIANMHLFQCWVEWCENCLFLGISYEGLETSKIRSIIIYVRWNTYARKCVVDEPLHECRFARLRWSHYDNFDILSQTRPFQWIIYIVLSHFCIGLFCKI